MNRGLGWARGTKQSPEWIAKRVAAIAKTKATKGFRSTLHDRFNKYVLKTDSCWIWNGPLMNAGYGILSDGRAQRNLLVHRLAWEWCHGPIPPGLDICHHCDNPRCVNPDHLFLGTQSDNMKDFWQKHPWHKPGAGQQHTTEWKRATGARMSEEYRQGRREAVRTADGTRFAGSRIREPHSATRADL